MSVAMEVVIEKASTIASILILVLFFGVLSM